MKASLIIIFVSILIALVILDSKMEIKAQLIESIECYSLGQCNTTDTVYDSGGCGTSCGEYAGAALETEPWSRYEVRKCTVRIIKDPTDPFSNVTDFDYQFTPLSEKICSAADKYDSNDPARLRFGSCDCGVGKAYKVCCSDEDPTREVPAQVLSIDTINPPYEAICPLGSHDLGPFVTSCPKTIPAVDLKIKVLR